MKDICLNGVETGGAGGETVREEMDEVTVSLIDLGLELTIRQSKIELELEDL